ncbi:MAG: tetratricopeptide repeat protein [Aureliella sp.]
MCITNGRVCAMVALTCQLLFGAAVNAQAAAPAFERCLQYATEFEELNNQYSLYKTSAEKLSGEREDALERLAQTNQSVAQLIAYGAMQRMLALEGQLIGVNQQAAVDSELARKANAGETLRPSTPNAPLRIANQQVAQTQVQLDVMYHNMKTTDQAGRLVLERRKSIIEELQSIAAEFKGLDAKQLELFDRYWELADVARVRSDLELRAALRQLRQADSENSGAQFAMAITLMRLGDFDAALTLLNPLVQVPAIRAVALAARSELYVRMDKREASASDMRQAVAMAKNDPRVRMHCAMAHSAAESFKAAETEWNAVLKLGSQEVAARRALALLHASAPTPSEHNRKTAAESAELAAKLAGEDDWACNLALALAAQVNGDKEKAIRSAQRASDCAIGEKRIYCDGVLEQIEAGQRVFWRF